MSNKKRISISVDKLLDAYPVDRSASTNSLSQNFVHSIRNKKPLIIAGGALGWLGIDTALGPVDTILELVEKSETDVLVALDGRQFLKNDLCSFKRVDVAAGIMNLLRRNVPKICNEDEHFALLNQGSSLIPIPDKVRTYLRIYFDTHPKLLGQINLDYLVTLMSPIRKSEANIDRVLQLKQQSSFFHADIPPSIPSLVESLKLLSPTSGIIGDTSPFQLKNIGLWASSQGCVTPLHFDLCHGFLAQIIGMKTFILASSEDFVLNRYWKSDRKKNKQNGTTSAIDFALWLDGDMKERSKHPLLDEVAWFIASLSPGDILYTPPGWWHYVISDTVSVSILIPCDPIPHFDILPTNSLSI